MSNRQEIPTALLAVISEITSERETHASQNNLFSHAGASGDIPDGSKPTKAQAWLRATNRDLRNNPLAVAGKIIAPYMEVALDPEDRADAAKMKDRERIARTLAEYELQYVRGGKIVGALGAPSRTLEEFVRDHDSAAIEQEFYRALSNVGTSPREAVSAACNILESICKVYIVDEGLEMPAKQDIKPIWTVVRKHLGFDPSLIEDHDLQQVLSGMISVVEGIGALRTHASSAHGAGKKSYKLEPRHARLAVHAAHTVALFILESWQRKKSSGTG